MNAIAEQITEQLTIDGALAQVKAAVAELRKIEGEHLADEAALTRGRDRLASAEAELEKINADNQAAITRHAKRLEEQTRSGSTAPVPLLTLSDAHVSKELVAARTATAARQMMANLASAVQASEATVATAHATVTASLGRLREVEIHDRIHSGLILLDQFESTFAEIYARTETRGDSTFGDPIWDRDAAHQKLRAVWNVLEGRRLGLQSPATTGVLTPQPPLIAARQALAQRDAALTDPPPEQSS